VEFLAAAVLAVDLLVVVASVFARYVLHSPLQWSDEVARSMLVTLTFLGGAVALARNEHMGVEAIRSRLRGRTRAYVDALVAWVVLIVALALFWTGLSIVRLSSGETTSAGLPAAIFYFPLVLGAVAMAVFAVAALAREDRVALVLSAASLVTLVLFWWAWGIIFPGSQPVGSIVLLVAGFALALLGGVPVAFALALSALLFLWTVGTIPLAIFSQRMVAGVDNFVLLAIPFFVLAGLVMEMNGMSQRLIELLQLVLGRVRGGLSIVLIAAMYLFSGMSGSKSADVAAVGSLLVPAVRKARQNPADAVSLLAASAAMGETVPPCINMIILGSVANLSIGGLFLAGIVPAAVMAVALAVVAVAFGPKTRLALPDARPAERLRIFLGAAVSLLMIVIILGGILGGIATPTEVSAFAVAYALAAGWVMFRRTARRDVLRLFVDSASLSGMILFIVAAASSVSWILTQQRIPHAMADAMVALSNTYGVWMFIILALLFLIVMGSVLEGAPALIIFAPLLVPIAATVGINPLHFGIVLVIAMGIGLFSPPIGVGMYTACAIGKVPIEHVVKPYLKYFVMLVVCLVLIAFVPAITLWLPRTFDMAK
jgi:tripartite ATP-independent transporter DctM subunit